MIKCRILFERMKNGKILHTGGGVIKIPKDKMMTPKNIYAKLLFAILLLFGCQSVLISGGGGMSGIAHTKSGKQYRCFAEIGKSTHNQKLGNDKYCLPTPNTNGCQKQWQWFVNNKISDTTELGTNCNFTCRNDANFTTTGSSQPYTTYSYCVLNSDWNKVAKCVNKTEGKEESDTSKCESDTNGTTYYYKPKCDESDTKAECLAKLTALTNTLSSSTKWRFCYKYSEAPSDMFQNKGGQSVLFVEYKAQNNTTTFPCDQQSTAMVSGEAIIDKDKEDKDDTLGTLVILDEQDGDTKQTISKVHTKISGKDYKFRIFAVDSAGKFSSGLSSLTCTINEAGGATFSAQAQENGLLDAIFGGKGKNYIFGTYSPQSSGEATIACNGTSKDGKQVSASTSFFIAPHSYSYNIINAEFDGQNENLMNNTNKLPLLLDYATNENASKEITHDNDSWNKKPVVKLGGAIKVTLAEVQAMTAKNAIDTGVDSANNIGIITATPKVQVKGITDANKTPPNTSNSTCTTANQLNPSSVNMTQGKANGGELFIINEANTLLGEAEVEILDTALRDKIKAEMASSKCYNSGNFPCPYPQTLRLKFDYEVVPDDFKVELLDNNGNALKVLYFGQGGTPEIEAGNKLRLTALKANKTTATTFTNNCSAQNLALEIPTMQGKGFSLEVVDKNGAKPFVIPANRFINGVADNIEAIIKVDKDSGVPFTPNMKSEPVITANSFPDGIPATLSFALFPNSYYPKYDSKLENNAVILRARINAIDTDNHATNFGTASPTKVYYEFQCEYCNLDAVGKITGVNNYERSKTQQGWWIDKTFSTYNATQITKDKLEIENMGNAQIKAVSAVTNGFQDIAYNFLANGTYKLNIRHGNFLNGTTAIAMPNFLLYNAYWNQSVKWNTSAFIYIKGKADDEQRNYGVDTGGAKNTRSGGRIGRY